MSKSDDQREPLPAASPLDNLVEQFRAEMPPEDVRTKLSTIASQAANAAKLTIAPTPWWQRKVAVPVPVLLATAALFLIAIFLPRDSAEREPKDTLANRSEPNSMALPYVGTALPVPIAGAKGEAWSVHQSYLGTFQLYADSASNKDQPVEKGNDDV